MIGLVWFAALIVMVVGTIAIVYGLTWLLSLGAWFQ
jgi:hypothetical protein